MGNAVTLETPTIIDQLLNLAMHGFFIDEFLGFSIISSPFTKHLLLEKYLTHVTLPLFTS